MECLRMLPYAALRPTWFSELLCTEGRKYVTLPFFLHHSRRVAFGQQLFHFTISLDIKYRKVKLCDIHSMFLRDFPFWHFKTLLLRDSGKDFWIISIIPAVHNLDSFANDSTIFGKTTFLSLRMPNVARMYSSFAVSSSCRTVLGV